MQFTFEVAFVLEHGAGCQVLNSARLGTIWLWKKQDNCIQLPLAIVFDHSPASLPGTSSKNQRLELSVRSGLTSVEALFLFKGLQVIHQTSASAEMTGATERKL